MLSACFILILCVVTPVFEASKNVTSGDFIHVGEKEPWYINDHCVIQGDDGVWHMFGITHQEPLDPLHEHQFAHATAKDLLQVPWEKQNFALVAEDPETWLWAPHVIKKDDMYFMFYCGGGSIPGPPPKKWRIQIATSKDLYTWERIENEPAFFDWQGARDPMVLLVKYEGKEQYVIYYTLDTVEDTGSKAVVAYRTSSDLLHWSSERGIAYTLDHFSVQTESPFVVHHNEFYYLFLGNSGNKTYDRDYVFKSKSPFSWTGEDRIGIIEAHASEVITTKDGKYYITKCGWGRKGFYIAPLYFDD